MERIDLPLPAGYCLYLLGGFRLERDGTRIQLYSRKVESLLAYLQLFPQEHAREKLAALFWGDSTDEQARHSLRMGLSSIRKQLGEAAVLADRESIQFNPSFPLWVDTAEFRRLNSEFKIQVYRGDLLADFYDDWISPLRDEYRELYLGALLSLVERCRAQSEYPAAIEWAQKVLATDRANEQAHQHLMLCYAALGQRSAALQQYQDCKLALREELGVEPSQETRALYENLRLKSGTQSPAARLTNLPRPTTSFVGREKEIGELKGFLHGVQSHGALLTLAGPGGSGKTRLALEVGQQVVGEFADGVWWVDLTALMDAALISKQLAKSLGVQEQPNVPLDETLIEHLRAKESLVILDNCEHLLDGCAHLVERIRRACPNVSILATSREALNRAGFGEQIYPVPMLAAPPVTADSRQPITDPSNLLKYEAIRLFVERARTQQPAFRLSAHNAPLVTRICQALDAIPLALELAAAQIRRLGLEEIARRLEQRLELHDPAHLHTHHQSLRAALDWSYDLLDPAGQMLFGRLAVFAGGWTLEQALVVAGGYTGLETFRPADQSMENALPLPVTADFVMRALLNDLTGKSLIILETMPAPRYRFLETIREYARERLQDHDAAEAVRERHMAFFVALAEQAYRPEWEAQDPLKFAQLEIELDNLRAALESGLSSRNVELTLQLAGALGTFWRYQSHVQEGDSWYRRVLELAAQLPERGAPGLRARVLSHAGTLKWSQSNFLQAKGLHQQALDLYRAAEDLAGIAFSLHNIAVQCEPLGEHDAAQAALEEGLDFAQQSGDVKLEIFLLNTLAVHHQEARQDPLRARTLWEQALALARQTATPHHALLATNLAEVEAELGNHAQALIYLDEALVQLESHYEPVSQGATERAKGMILSALGETAAARLWLERSLQTFHKIDSRFEFCSALVYLAALDAGAGEHGRAATLAGYRHKEITETLGVPLDPAEQVWFEPLVNRLRETLGAGEFEQAWEKGRALTLDQIATLALKDPK